MNANPHRAQRLRSAKSKSLEGESYATLESPDYRLGIPPLCRTNLIFTPTAQPHTCARDAKSPSDRLPISTSLSLSALENLAAAAAKFHHHIEQVYRRRRRHKYERACTDFHAVCLEGHRIIEQAVRPQSVRRNAMNELALQIGCNSVLCLHCAYRTVDRYPLSTSGTIRVLVYPARPIRLRMRAASASDSEKLKRSRKGLVRRAGLEQ